MSEKPSMGEMGGRTKELIAEIGEIQVPEASFIDKSEAWADSARADAKEIESIKQNLAAHGVERFERDSNSDGGREGAVSVENKSSQKESNKMTLKQRLTRIFAAFLMLVGSGAVVHNVASASSERQNLQQEAELGKMLKAEGEIQQQNHQHILDHSEKTVYVVKNGDGLNHVLYATGWVGENLKYGDTKDKFTLSDMESIIKSMPENEKINFDRLDPNMEISIYTKN